MIQFIQYLFLCIISSTLLGLPTLALADNEQAVFTISFAQAETAVSQALTDKGAGEKISATITGTKNGALFSFTKPMTVEVRGLRFDKASNRWNASLLAVVGEAVLTAVPAAGYFDSMVEVPVLKHSARAGQIIGQADVEIRDFPAQRVNADSIMDLSQLIGKTSLRGISPLRPIREHEIAEPALVRKNDLVKLYYHAPGIHISASGQALEDGAKGKLIAVRNVSSKKMVYGTVDNAGSVILSPAVAPQNTTAQVTREDNPYATN